MHIEISDCDSSSMHLYVCCIYELHLSIISPPRVGSMAVIKTNSVFSLYVIKDEHIKVMFCFIPFWGLWHQPQSALRSAPWLGLLHSAHFAVICIKCLSFWCIFYFISQFLLDNISAINRLERLVSRVIGYVWFETQNYTLLCLIVVF